MKHFYIRPDAVTGDRVIFDAEESHHLARVLRLRPGALVQTVDGSGRELTVRVESISARAAEGRVIDQSVVRSESSLDLTLVQAVPKGDKLAGIIRMATELGVNRVVTAVTERTVARIDPAQRRARANRWQRIAREAAKQSGRATVPEVLEPLALTDWLGAPRAPGLTVCLWEGADAPLDAALPERPVNRASLIVGPEGGFTEQEVAGMARAGAIVAGLGPRILRTETAGPVGLALLQLRYGDLGK